MTSHLHYPIENENTPSHTRRASSFHTNTRWLPQRTLTLTSYHLFEVHLATASSISPPLSSSEESGQESSWSVSTSEASSVSASESAKEDEKPLALRVHDHFQGLLCAVTPSTSSPKWLLHYCSYHGWTCLQCTCMKNLSKNQSKFNFVLVLASSFLIIEWVYNTDCGHTHTLSPVVCVVSLPRHSLHHALNGEK